MIGANYWSVAASGVQSLYCDLCATPWWWSSVLLKLCGGMLQVYDMNNSTIMGNGIMQYQLTLHYQLSESICHDKQTLIKLSKT